MQQAQQGGYTDTTRRPAGIAFVIALHAVAVGAVLLIPAQRITREIFHRPPIIYNVPEPKDPPPIPMPRETPRAAQPSDRHIDVVTPSIATHGEGPTLPPSPPLPPIESGRGIEPPPLPPVPDAVRIEARVDPRYAEAFQPAYPQRLMRQAVEGRVSVRVLVGADGRVKAVEPVTATDPLFLEATRRQALAHWRFLPATKDGVPVESWRTMTVRFEMKA